MAVNNKYMPKANEAAIPVMFGGVQKMILSTQDVNYSKIALFCCTETQQN
jgi:hypothetical protein